MHAHQKLKLKVNTVKLL